MLPAPYILTTLLQLTAAAASSQHFSHHETGSRPCQPGQVATPWPSALYCVHVRTHPASQRQPLTQPQAASSSVQSREQTCLLVQVPPTQVVKTADFLEGLAAQPDEPCNWELGGQTNVLISAARLGLRAAAVCSLGDDAHGAFLREELKVTQHLLPKAARCCFGQGGRGDPGLSQWTANPPRASLCHARSGGPS